MIKISHEVPICLLENSRHFNDYDYCLAHLMDENPTYRDFFLQSKQLNREIYLDNSVHELGYAYDTNRLKYWIEQLQPSSFFIPDVWENATSTIVNAKAWATVQLPEKVKKVAVVQAKNLLEASISVQIYKDLGYKRIAFSYGASYYGSFFPHLESSIGKALGRVLVINKLYENGILNDYDDIHLLGTACPIEFSFYKKFKFIKSIDTSNPIMATIDNIEYDILGAHPKPKSNINSVLDISLDKINNSILNHNILTFRNIVNNK